jgi:hypothetical protein
VKCDHSSAGKKLGTGGAKIGNVHLKWAFSEAAVLSLRNNPEGQKHQRRLAGKHGKAKALSILAAKLGRAVYFILSKERVFEHSSRTASSHEAERSGGGSARRLTGASSHWEQKVEPDQEAWKRSEDL